MNIDELIKQKKDKRQQLSQGIMQMRAQAEELEVAIRRAEGRYQEVAEDLAALGVGEAEGEEAEAAA